MGHSTPNHSGGFGQPTDQHCYPLIKIDSQLDSIGYTWKQQTRRKSKVVQGKPEVTLNLAVEMDDTPNRLSTMAQPTMVVISKLL